MRLIYVFIYFLCLTASCSAPAAFLVDKNLLLPAVDSDREIDAKVQGLLLDQNATTAIVEFFSSDESLRFQQSNYECESVMLLPVQPGVTARLCGPVTKLDDFTSFQIAEKDGLAHVGCMTSCSELHPWGTVERLTCQKRCIRQYGF